MTYEDQSLRFCVLLILWAKLYRRRCLVSIGCTCAYLVRKGKIRRVSRGRYAAI